MVSSCFTRSFQLLHAIQLFGANLDDYLHLMLPPMVKLFDTQDVPLPVRKYVTLLPTFQVHTTNIALKWQEY